MTSTQFRRILTDYAGMALVLAVLIAIFGFSAQNFFTMTTLRTIANQIPSLVVVAVGMTYVLIIAGIDLSVGSLLGLSGAVLGAALVKGGMPLAAALPLCLLAGLLCGAANGLVTAMWGVPSFIVTLGMLEASRGAAYLVTNSQTMYIGAPVERIAEVTLAGFSLPFIVALLVVAAGQVVLSRTVFGRYMVAIGTNEEAVRLSGIDPRPVKVAVFALSGMLSALAAVVQCSRLGSADPNAGAGLAQVGAQEPTKRLITGLVILAAVLADKYRQRA